MSADDARRWDARYADCAVAEPGPPDALAEAGLTDLLHGPGRALDIACGAGAQSVWLAAQDFDVVAIDGSKVAIDLATAAAARAGVAAFVEARVVDLDDGIPDDLGVFDVVVCQRFRSSGLYGPIVDRLRRGGVAVVTVLSETGASSPGPFHARPGELLEAFTRADTEVLHHCEHDGHESVVLRRR